MRDRQHKNRIKEELANAGATRYGLLKSESRYLPKIVHQNEHIHAVVYGQFDNNSAMLVATDSRVIYLDCKPMTVLMDEITYDVVQGVEFDIHAITATLIMQTNIGNYKVKYANIKCASKFAEFLESKKLSKVRKVGLGTAEQLPTRLVKSTISNEALDFLKSNYIGVFSTAGSDGNVDSAAVYYVYYLDHIYILTKSSTKKAQNIYYHKQVSFTVFDEQNLQTVQIHGDAEVEKDPAIAKQIFNYMIQPRQYKGQQKLPPVAKNQYESYLVIKILPTQTRFSDYST